MAAASERSRAHLDEVYSLLPFEPTRGEGAYLYDSADRRVLDLYGGHAVAVLGYGHARLSKAIADQAQRMLFQSNLVRVATRDRAAERLVEFAGGTPERVFFVNSGAEANENALRLACKLTGRAKIVALEHGFHGRTAAAAAVSHGSAKGWYGFPRLPFDVEFVPRDDVARLERALDAQAAAVILEPVQGLAGAYDLSREFVHAARARSAAVGALMIMDEVQTGMGRLGAAFGARLFDVVPDLLSTAKGLAGGVPAGALLMRADIARELGSGDLATTFGGGPVACAAINAVIDAIEHEALLANVREVSAAIRARCLTGPVRAIQGHGFLLGLRTEPRAAAVRDALLARDILTGTSTDPHILRLLPPLILTVEQVDRLAAALGDLTHAALS